MKRPSPLFSLKALGAACFCLDVTLLVFACETFFPTIKQNTQDSWVWGSFATALVILLMDIIYLIITCRGVCIVKEGFHRVATWYILLQILIRTVLLCVGIVANLVSKIPPDVWAAIKTTVHGMSMVQVFLMPIGWVVLFVLAATMIGAHQRYFRVASMVASDLGVPLLTGVVADRDGDLDRLDDRDPEGEDGAADGAPRGGGDDGDGGDGEGEAMLPIAGRAHDDVVDSIQQRPRVPVDAIGRGIGRGTPSEGFVYVDPHA
jgi:hypothetical protein